MPTVVGGSEKETRFNQMNDNKINFKRRGSAWAKWISRRDARRNAG